VTSAELLKGLRRTLADIVRLVAAARTSWDADRLLRLGVMKLWIDAGNYAESYSRAIGVSTRVEPWSELVGYRSILAHQLPEDLNDDRLWDDVRDATRVLADVSAAAV
jgi:hypothetical protein